MSRLIDADALLENQPKGCYRTSDWINAAPTIDAIPVEWLNKQCEMADDRGDMEMTDAISWLIQTWHEEQEAQDGKA